MRTIFDTLQYTKDAEAIGIKREHAEYHARQIAKLLDNELPTKSFVLNELKNLEITMIKWMIGLCFAQVGLILGVLGFIMKIKG